MKASRSPQSRFQRYRIQNYLGRGAIIIDVRSKREWTSGHIPNSKNIESSAISNHVAELVELGRPLIIVCVSGYRSGIISAFLSNQGIDVINGGSWRNVAELMTIENHIMSN